MNLRCSQSAFPLRGRGTAERRWMRWCGTHLNRGLCSKCVSTLCVHLISHGYAVPAVSLRLGPLAVLTVRRTVIHYCSCRFATLKGKPFLCPTSDKLHSKLPINAKKPLSHRIEAFYSFFTKIPPSKVVRLWLISTKILTQFQIDLFSINERWKNADFLLYYG